MPIAVVAVIKVTSGKKDELLRLFADQVKFVKENEPDTLAYQATIDPKQPDHITIVERYKDQAALKKHGSSDAFKNFGRAMKKQDLGSIAKINVYEEVASAGFTSRL